jgi:hypothetical protein
MWTSKSPRKVFRLAHTLARRVLPRYSSKYSRHDFTWPELFACLVLREHQKKSYRGIEALLNDTTWCQEIGMNKVPDHNTLYRAFHAILSEHCVSSMLTLLAHLSDHGRGFGKVLGADTTYMDTHHHSRHYEHRCRRSIPKALRNSPLIKARQRARVAAIPKLVLGVEVKTHWIVAVVTRVGMRGDQPEFPPLLKQTCRRVPGVQVILADAGFDAHANHVLAREHYNVRSLIQVVRKGPTALTKASRYRTLMKHQLKGSQKGRLYAQRAQVETVNSMIKRNLGDSLRARSSDARKMEMALRAITHNVMI